MSYEGITLREKMLGTFGAMLRPARMIINMSQEELAQLSGLSEELISGVENGMHRFHEEHYLALAAVFDNTKFTREDNIYKALIRVLTPDNEFNGFDNSGDFVLVRRWFSTFNNEADNISDEDEENEENFPASASDYLTDDELEQLANEYKIFADASAVEDENFQALVSRFEPLLRQADAVISVPDTAIEELKEDIAVCDDEDQELSLSDALKYVTRRIEEGLIKERYFDNDEDFETGELLAKFFEDSKDDYKFALITQDAEVANAVMSDNVRAFHMDDKGDLIAWR